MNPVGMLWLAFCVYVLATVPRLLDAWARCQDMPELPPDPGPGLESALAKIDLVLAWAELRPHVDAADRDRLDAAVRTVLT